MTHIPYNPFTLEATHPKAWWRPVFNTVLVSFIALMVFTRLARNSIFWIGAGFWALYFCLFTMVLYIMCMLKTQ